MKKSIGYLLFSAVLFLLCEGGCIELTPALKIVSYVLYVPSIIFLLYGFSTVACYFICPGMRYIDEIFDGWINKDLGEYYARKKSERIKK